MPTRNGNGVMHSSSNGVISETIHPLPQHNNRLPGLATSSASDVTTRLQKLLKPKPLPKDVLASK